MADEENPYARPSATTVETPPGVPRITVTPGGAEENPYARPPPSKEVQVGREQASMSLPAWTGQGVHDFFSAANKMGTAGMMPRIYAGIDTLFGQQPDYDTALKSQLGRYAQQRERSPYASFGGDVAGGAGAGIATGALGVGPGIAARLGAGPAARLFGFGTEAAGQGAVQGAGHTYSGEVEDYIKNAGKGAAVSAAIGGPAGLLVPRSAVQQRAGDPRTGQPIRPPSEAELKALSDRGYQVLSRIPVTYPGKHLQGTLSQAESQMMAQNVAPEQAQTVFRILERVRNHPGSISPAQIDGIRQSLNNMKNVPTPGAEKAGVAAAILRDALDDMIQNGTQVASNPALAAQAARVVERARGDRAAMFRSQQLTDPARTAANPAARGGPPVGEKLGPVSDKLLKWERGQQPNTRGWVDEERARVAAAVTPTAAERVASGFADLPLKTIGAGVGGALGGGTGGGVGLIAGNLVGSVPGALGGGTLGAGLGAAVGAGAQRLARGFGTRGIENRWNEAAQAMRGRSPAYERALQGAVPVPGPGMGRTGQGLIGAGTAELATPYDDGRAALVPSLMNQLVY